jgi:hypothetical protein
MHFKKNKKGISQKMIDVFFDLFILIIAMSGIYIFTTNTASDKIYIPFRENEVYINHLFSNPACLALERNGMIYPYQIDYAKTTQIINSDLKGKENGDASKTCLRFPEGYSMFATEITITPVIENQFEKMTIYYDKDLYERWSPVAQSDENGIKSNILLIKSQMLVKCVDELQNEFLALATIKSVIPK